MPHLAKTPVQYRKRFFKNFVSKNAMNVLSVIKYQKGYSQNFFEQFRKRCNIEAKNEDEHSVRTRTSKVRNFESSFQDTTTRKKAMASKLSLPIFSAP